MCYDPNTMKRKIAFLLTFLGLVVIVVVVIRALTGRGTKQGELRVDVSPAAAIFLDSKNIGRSPFKDKVNEGTYTLKLVPETTTSQLAGWEGKIIVGPNLLTYVNATLSESDLTNAVDVLWLEKISSKQSELSVTTTPDGATVLVDDVTRGVTPLSLTDITPGEHNITVTNTGFSPRSLKLITSAGYRLILSMKLALSSGTVPEATATPTVTSTGTPTPTQKATTEPEKPFITIGDTPTGFLRVRLEPTTSATEAGRVNPGDMFHIESEESGWYQISYDGTNTGWVSGQYATKTE